MGGRRGRNGKERLRVILHRPTVDRTGKGRRDVAIVSGCLVDIEKAPKPMPACATPVTNGRLNGDQITFTAGGNQYSGYVNGDVIEGNAGSGGSWKATRAGK